MRRKPDIDISIMPGTKRQAERSDKPPHYPSYSRNTIQPKVGVLTRRPGTELAYPDRGNEYQYTTPEKQRHLDTTPDVPGNDEIFYNSHKRKTIALGKSGDTHYVFAGKVHSHDVSAEWQRLEIHRGKLGSDGVTVSWDEDYTFSATYGKIDHALGSHQHIYYSMVMNATMDSLYIIISKLDSLEALHSVIDVVVLTDLYKYAWGEDGVADFPTWSSVGTIVSTDNEDGKWATQDVDIEIETNGDLHVVYGWWDQTRVGVKEWLIHYDKYVAGEWTYGSYDTALVLTEADSGLFGAVLKASSKKIYMGYLKHQVDSDTIKQLVWDIGSGMPNISDATIICSDPYVGGDSDDYHNYGPVLAIDTKDTVVYGYKRLNDNTVYVKIGAGSEQQAGNYVVEKPEHGRTNWDLIVKDGVLIVYWSHFKQCSVDSHRLGYNHYQIFRRILVFDTTDADYNDGDWFAPEFVEENVLRHVYLTAYNTFESDNPKRFTTITTNDDPLIPAYFFDSIRQDHGVLDGTSEITQSSIHRYSAMGSTGSEYLTVLQCRLPSGRARFYYRSDWQWNLLEGQMDEGNNGIIQSTIVYSGNRAYFWDMNKGLRAGCGLGLNSNPIWYKRIDRVIYNNDNANRLQGRRFRIDQIKPPTVGRDFKFGIVEITGWNITNGNPDEDLYETFANRFEKYIDADGNVVLLGDSPNVEHPYKILGDLGAAAFEAGGNWQNADPAIKQRYIEAFVGFAYRYDDGQVSQITPQWRHAAYNLGTEIIDGVVFINPLSIEMLQVDFQLERWNDVGGGMDPRITGIVCFIGERTIPGQTKWDVGYRLWKEFLVAKPEAHHFKDEPDNGDSVWAVAGRYATLTGYLDYLKYVENLTAEDDVYYIGTGAVMNRWVTGKSYLDSYKRALVVDDRPFYLGVGLNNRTYDNFMMWAVDAIQGGERFVCPDVISPAYVKPFQFKLMGGLLYDDGNLGIFGDKDIETGKASGEELKWSFHRTFNDIGCLSEDSICKLSEGGGLSGGFFLSKKAGGQLFNLFSATPITGDILEDFISGAMPVATRVATTYKGVKSLAADDAMAIYLPEQRLLLVHFPADGITMVRDFNAEDNSGEVEWREWEFAHNPKAWCVAPEGHLLYTDEEFVYKFPKITEDGKDVYTAIEPSGRHDFEVPEDMTAFMKKIGAVYQIAGTTLKLTVIRDDGQKTDLTATFAEKTIKGEADKTIGWQKKINDEFAIAWELTTPADCTDFELHKIFAWLETQRWR